VTALSAWLGIIAKSSGSEFANKLQAVLSVAEVTKVKDLTPSMISAVVGPYASGWNDTASKRLLEVLSLHDSGDDTVRQVLSGHALDIVSGIVNGPVSATSVCPKCRTPFFKIQ